MECEITLEGVSLDYPIYNQSNLELRKLITNFFDFKKENSKSDILTIQALKNIDIKFKSGDRVALLGPNGSGKSTLLRVIGNIYKPTKGRINVNRKPYSLLDLGMGIQGDATGYENIYLMAYLRGMGKKEIDEKIKWIIEFSGLNEAISREARTYSSGMIVRLAVSIVLSNNPDIFLIDEFFSAGDKEFMEKTTLRMKELISKTGIFIIATHDEGLANEMCNKRVFLNKGEIIKIET